MRLVMKGCLVEPGRLSLDFASLDLIFDNVLHQVLRGALVDLFLLDNSLFLLCNQFLLKLLNLMSKVNYIQCKLPLGIMSFRHFQSQAVHHLLSQLLRGIIFSSCLAVLGKCLNLFGEKDAETWNDKRQVLPLLKLKRDSLESERIFHCGLKILSYYAELAVTFMHLFEKIIN